MAKVLIVAYRFPPQGGGGVQRTLKFVKYLGRFGWQPVVHTVRNPYWPLRDETLVHEIPDDVKVYRTPTFEFERLENRLSRMLSTNDGRQVPLAQKDPSKNRDPSSMPKKIRGAVASLRGMVHKRILMPDPQIAWLPWALGRSLYIARREHPDVIYTSSPPNSVQLLGLLLKRMLKRPWVVDFRDPWTEGVRRKQAYVNNAFRSRREESWERAVVERADCLIVTSERTKEQFADKYPFLVPKLAVLTNGFDSADFNIGGSDRKLLSDRYFHVTLTGGVEPEVDLMPFFGAVKELVEESHEMRGRLRINFVGTKRRVLYDEYIEANSLDSQVTYLPYMPHADSVGYLANSDVLFLNPMIPVSESGGTKLPGKLFEYLYMRKPILALTIPGEAARILDRSGLGVVVNPSDQPAIKAALWDLFRQWQEGEWRFKPDGGFIQSFDRVRLTEKLAGIFNGLTMQREGGVVCPSGPVV